MVLYGSSLFSYVLPWSRTGETPIHAGVSTKDFAQSANTISAALEKGKRIRSFIQNLSILFFATPNTPHFIFDEVQGI
jgi:hypothetical protein